MALNFAYKSAKATIGFSAGIVTGICMISFLDDMIYYDLKKHVFLPYKMVSINSNNQTDVKLAQAKAVAQGTASFFNHIKPNFPSGNAKELIVHDDDYSTPQDHYFAYMQKRKQAGFSE